MKNCDVKFVKYILFLFNLVFAISGIALIVVGCVVLADVGEYRHFMEGRIIAPPIVLIVAGSIVFIVAFLGCFGAIRENYHMLMGFAVLLLIIFIIELAVGIAAAVYKHDFQMIMKDSMKTSMGQYYDSKVDRISWDNLQTKLECCGIEGPTDWPAKQRPYTCCHKVREGAQPPEDFHCQAALPGEDILYSDGCFDKLKMKAESNAKILIGVGIGIAFIQLIGIILSCWLAVAVKKKE
ncbi:PREDICTED: leukocyte surface antigen CD53 [Nicrophorus vespilloides]|uniref:Tetraspanin n=1 Tax=Nicrophorus vespilloides TaxID=110193 RepID=A0ABM1MDK9_NICVS|nr:PREDICTED: leukocyte surface antigen CD53 [Nicrophorus vespilloides]